MKKHPLSFKDQSTLINPEISKPDLVNLIQERLDQLEGMAYMLNNRGDDSAGDLADYLVNNAHWLVKRTLSETKNLFDLYIKKY